MNTLVTISRLTNPTALYRHYEDETSQQTAYIELDLDNRILLADYDAELDTKVPVTVVYGIDRRYNIPAVTAEAANRAMEQILPLAQRIMAGTEMEWNGNNTVAVLNADAQAAEEELEQTLAAAFDESDEIAAWDVDSATTGTEASDYDITATTTDARLDEIAEEIISGLADESPSGVATCHGLTRYLRTLRDQAEDES
jgi:hypothetical protein